MKEEFKNLDTKEFLTNLMKFCPDAIFTIKLPERQIEYVNQAGYTMFGYTPEEVIGKTTRIFYPDEFSYASFGQKLQTAIARGEIKVLAEQRLIKKDGSSLWVEIHTTFLFSDGNPLKVISMLRDITERKRIEESLRLSEEKFSKVFHLSPDPNAITTLGEGRILEINKNFERIFGYSREEVIGRTSTELNLWINPKDRERFVEKLHRKDFVQNVKIKFRARSGEMRTCLVSADIIQLEGQKCLLSIVRDITEVKRSMQRQRVQTTITQIMAGSDTMEDVSIKLLQGIGESLDWDIGELWGVDEKGNVLRCLKIWHNPSIKIPTFKKFTQEIPFEIGTGLPGRVWASGKPDWIADVTNDSNFPRREFASREDIHGAFAFPIFYTGKIEYIICFYNRLILSPDNDLLKILGAVSIQIGNLFERKKSQEALRKSEERYRTLAEAANDGIFIVNHQGFIQFVNKFAANMAGYLPSEMTGMNIDNLFKPEVANKYRDNLKKVAERGMPAYDEEKSSFKDRTIWLGTLLCPITNESGDITAIMGISRDITGRKEAEHEMEIQKNYFQQLFENSPDGIVLLDTTDRIVNCNRAFNSIFQYPLDEIKGKKINDIIVPNSLQVEAEQLSLQSRNGVIYQKETIRKRRDGGILNVLLTGYPIMIDNQVVGACVIYVDITAQKQLTDQLRHAQKLESLGTLAGGIAHDFNNILAIIMGHASLHERACADPDKLALSIESINKATQRGAGLVRQLLTFAHKTDTVFELVNINEIVKEVAKLFRETFPKTIIISTDLAAKLPSITADQNQVHQLFINLCVNARDAMPEGGRLSISTGVVEGKFLLSRYPKAGAREYVRTSITDTGMGMDKDTLSRIFEPFFTTKGPGKGTGLGLSVVFGIVEQHNGFIDAESEIGKGTTFQVFFPVPERVIEGLEKQTEIIPEVPGGEETILIVEDEEMLRELAKTILSLKGYNVIQAGDGEEAVDIYSHNYKEIAMVLSDIGLPKFGGLELFKRLKAINPMVKVVFASGYIEPDIRSEMNKAGVKDFIQKPYLPDEILKKVREIIDSKV